MTSRPARSTVDPSRTTCCCGSPPGGPPACGGESGVWKRLVTDDLGRLIDHGRTTYRPPADLKRFVIARDRTCRFPHCNLPRNATSPALQPPPPATPPPATPSLAGAPPSSSAGGPPLRRPLRTRSPPRLGGRRPHQRRQPRRVERPSPPPETRSRLELGTPPRRHDRMDQPGRARLPQTTRDLSHRRNPRPAEINRARRTRTRSRPTVLTRTMEAMDT
jgi:hypothetical protein